MGPTATAAASSGPGGGWNANNQINRLNGLNSLNGINSPNGQLAPLPPPSGYQAPPVPPTGMRSGREFPNSVFDKLQAIAPIPGQAPVRVADDQVLINVAFREICENLRHFKVYLST